MRRRTLLLFVALILATSGVAYAAGVNGAYKGKDIVKVTLDGKTVKPEKVPGYLEDGYTMVPLGMLRQMGITVEWNQKTLTANVKLPPPTVRTVPVLTKPQLEQLSEYVYKVTTGPTKDYPNGKLGSGFIVDGYLITAEHVVSGTEYAQVLIDGTWQKTTKYDFMNRDVTGFKVSNGTGFTYSTDLPQINDPVYAIGYPNGKLTITEGKVLEIWKDNGTLIRHSAQTDPGMSGGVLLNGRGQVIGVNSFGGGIGGIDGNFASPISRVEGQIK